MNDVNMRGFAMAYNFILSLRNFQWLYFQSVLEMENFTKRNAKYWSIQRAIETLELKHLANYD